MKNSIAILAVAAAPFASALQQSSSGGAKIINYCDIDIPMQNTPALGTGIENAEQEDKILKKGNSGPDSEYFTPWIALLTAGGWSAKLDTLGNWDNIMQYEWTWKTGSGDGQIWYDMSFVDGKASEHPKWEFICPDAPEAPHNNAYEKWNDDAIGMQKPVDPSATVTLALCPENSGSAGGYIASSDSAPAPSSVEASEAPETTAAPTPAPAAPSSTLATSVSSLDTVPIYNKAASIEPAPTEPAPTETAPAAVAPVVDENGDVEIVTAYATQVVTAVVTETAHAKKRRHEHRHPHGHNF